jgi:hypothetical protein
MICRLDKFFFLLISTLSAGLLMLKNGFIDIICVYLERVAAKKKKKKFFFCFIYSESIKLL